MQVFDDRFQAESGWNCSFPLRPAYSSSDGLNLVKGADGSGLYWPDIENFLGVLLAVSNFFKSDTPMCFLISENPKHNFTSDNFYSNTFRP